MVVSSFWKTTVAFFCQDVAWCYNGEVPLLQLFSTHRHSAPSPSDLDHRAMGDSPLSPLPSPPDLEAGLSGDTHNGRNYKSIAVLSPRPRSMTAGFFLDAISNEEPRHFLDACALCKKLLGFNCDIYMYRGDTPFCSEECRQEQIEMDEAMEKSRKVASLKKASSPIRDQEKSSATSPPRERAAHIRASTVVAG